MSVQRLFAAVPPNKSVLVGGRRRLLPPAMYNHHSSSAMSSSAMLSSAEREFRENVLLTRQDSLDDAMQIIHRDLSGQATPPFPAISSSSSSSSPRNNDLDFDSVFADLSSYNVNDMHTAAATVNALDDDDANKQLHMEKDMHMEDLDEMDEETDDCRRSLVPSFVDLQPISTCSIVDIDQLPTSFEQAVPGEPTHVLYPGIRTPLPVVKTEHDDIDHDDGGHLVSFSWATPSRPVRPKSVAVRRLKRETDLVRTSATPDPVSASSPGGAAHIAMPKPRKYERKADTEKTSQTYKAKRAKNNDAVRRSRAKAKGRQMQTEERNNQLEEENAQLKSENKKLRSENSLLKTALMPKRSAAASTESASVEAKRRRL